MRFSTAATSLLSVAGYVAAQQTHVIKVGDGGLTFNPSSLTAPIGDTVQFQFVAKNHSVTQSTFASPCVMKNQGVDSGFLAAPQGVDQLPAWSFTIDSTDDLWFFCAQIVNGTSHCSQGMVFALNPTPEKTFDAFKAAAMNNAGAGGAAGGANGTASVSASATGSAASGAASASATPSGAAGATGASSAADASATPTSGTGNAAADSASQNAGNGALGLSGNVVSILSAAGLVLGLML